MKKTFLLIGCAVLLAIGIVSISCKKDEKKKTNGGGGGGDGKCTCTYTYNGITIPYEFDEDEIGEMTCSQFAAFLNQYGYGTYKCN